MASISKAPTGSNLRVFHFIPSLDSKVGGPARAVIDISRLLAAEGHHVTIATSDVGDFAKEEFQDPLMPGSIVLEDLGVPELFGLAFARGGIQRAADLLVGQDVVHFHGVWELTISQLAALSRKMGKPYVVSPRGMLDQWSLQQKYFKKWIYLRLIGSRMLRSANAVHFTAMAERVQSLAWCGPAPAVVIPNFLDLRAYRELPGAGLAESAFGLPIKVPRVLFLSRIHPKKGIDVLLEAFAILMKTGKRIVLIVAGSGEPAYVARMRELSKSLGIAESVVFVGNVTGLTKISLLQACDVFVLPTQQENFGFVLFEALVCGLPVLTTPEIDLRRELEASGAVTICRRSGDAFAEAIDLSIVEDRKSSVVGVKGREWVFQWLDRNSLAVQYQSMYRAAIDSAIAKPGVFAS